MSKNRPLSEKFVSILLVLGLMTAEVVRNVSWNLIENATNAFQSRSYIHIFISVGKSTALSLSPCSVRKEEAALNKFHHLRRKVAAAQ